ncbi:hypothetical protein D3C81_672770 [compost metagenome]
MTEAPECRAFYGQGIGRVGVDLDDVAVGAGLVAKVIAGAGAARGDVEAAEFAIHFSRIARHAFPLVVTGLGAHADALLVGRQGGAGVDENPRPVLFAGQIGAPRGVAVAAIVVGAASLGAVLRETRLDVLAATQGACDVHHRGGGEAAVERVVVDHLPAAADFLQADHPGAMGVDLLAYFLDRTLAAAVAGRAVGMQGVGVDVFVVDRQQAVFGAAVDGEEMHAVMVHAHRVGLVGGGVAAVGFPRVGAGVQRRAPGRQDVGCVSGGDHAGVGARAGDGGEAQFQFRRGWWLDDRFVVIRVTAVEATRQASPGNHRDRGAQATAYHAAAAQVRLQNAVHGQVATLVAVQVVAGVSTHQFSSFCSMMRRERNRDFSEQV